MKFKEKFKNAVKGVGEYVYDHRGAIGAAVGWTLGVVATALLYETYEKKENERMMNDPYDRTLLDTLGYGRLNSNYTDFLTMGGGLEYGLSDYGRVGEEIGKRNADLRGLDWDDEDVRNDILDNKVVGSIVFVKRNECESEDI